MVHADGGLINAEEKYVNYISQRYSKQTVQSLDGASL
jgi:hypothetical protein